MFRLQLVLFLAVCAVNGCAKKSPPPLYFYCSETFWYVMQYESIVFNEIYGQKMILIPIRPPLSSEKISPQDNAIHEQEAASPLTPVPWKSMPVHTNDESAKPFDAGKLHPAIAEQLTDISKKYFGDGLLTDSPRQLTKVKELDIIADEQPFCYLTLALLTPTGNPKQFTSVKSVFDKQCTLGMTAPDIDGLGETSWNMLTKLYKDAVPEKLIRRFERQYELLNALETGSIDAALVWDGTSVTVFLLEKYGAEYNEIYSVPLKEAQMSSKPEKMRAALKAVYEEIIQDKRFGEKIALTDIPEERYVIQVPLLALSSTNNIAYNRRVADFLSSHQGQAIFRQFGFQ